MTASKSPYLRKKKGLKRKWLKYYLDDGNSKTFLNGTQSAIAAGYKTSAKYGFSQIGSYNRSEFAPIIEKWLDEVGLGENALKAKLLSLTEAKQDKIIKMRGAINHSSLDDGCTILAETSDVFDEGETLVAISQNDNSTQVKTLQLGMTHKKMLTTVVEVQGMDGIAERILANREKRGDDVFD